MNLRTRCLSLVLFSSVVGASTLHAQDLAGYEKLLLPAFSSGRVAGINGTTFETFLRGYTEVATPYYAGVPLGSSSEPAFVTQPAFNPIFRPLNYGPPGPSGRFLYIEKTSLSHLSLQYFLASTGADATRHVTALPVVRVPLTDASRILAIPNNPILEWPNGQPAGEMRGYTHRNSLRVYDFDGDGSAQVSIERFVEGYFGRQGSLGKVILNLDQRYGDDPTFPYFGQLDLNYCLPFSVHTPCSRFSMRIEIVPITPRLRYWGFVSSTDNITAGVTIFAPQPPSKTD